MIWFLECNKSINRNSKGVFEYPEWGMIREDQRNGWLY